MATEEREEREVLANPNGEPIEDDRIVEATKIAYLLDELHRFAGYMSEANQINEALPRSIKERAEDEGNKADPSMTLSLLPKEVREDWIRFQYELATLLETMVGAMKQAPWSTEANRRMVICYVKIIDRLMARSKLQTEQFFQAALVGDNAVLMLRCNGSKLEASYRHNVPSEMLEWFGLD